jgi:hypothetical protein
MRKTETDVNHGTCTLFSYIRRYHDVMKSHIYQQQQKRQNHGKKK